MTKTKTSSTVSIPSDVFSPLIRCFFFTKNRDGYGSAKNLRLKTKKCENQTLCKCRQGGALLSSRMANFFEQLCNNDD